MNWISALICLILIVVLVFIIYYGYHILEKSNRNIEKYESPSDERTREKMSQIVLAFLRDNGYTDFEELKKFVQGQYEENLDDIYEDHTLTLYYSAFSKGSYTNDEESKRWMNISPFLKNEKEKEKEKKQNNIVLPYDKSHIVAGDESPYVQRRDGISLRDQVFIGPPSHLLGIKGNSSFTIFMVLRFNRFTKIGERHGLLKLYGNTLQNNGIDLTIEPEPHEKDAQLISVKFIVQFGSDQSLQESVRLNISKPYMFMLKKELKSLSLVMHDMSSDASSESSKVIISPKDVQNNDVLFSNKEVHINQNKAIDGLLYAFGIYNESLVDASNLHHHLFKELDKRTETFMSKSRLMVAFQQELEQMRACPYDVNTCRECADVEDWTNINEIIISSDKCKKAIHQYCNENPQDSKCLCWREDKKEHVACQAFVNLFREDKLNIIENLTDEQIEEIKKKYKLCACEEVERLQLQEKKKQEQEIRKKEQKTSSYKLSSSHIPPRDIEYKEDEDPAIISPDTIDSKRSLLKYLPEETLPEVNNFTMNRIAQQPKGYKGNEDDLAYFNKPINQTYGDPSSPILKNMDEFDYGAKEINPSRSFWGWLFGKA